MLFIVLVSLVYFFQRISDSRFMFLKNNLLNLLGLCHFPLKPNLQACTDGRTTDRQTDRRTDRWTGILIPVGLGNLSVHPGNNLHRILSFLFQLGTRLG